MHDNAIHDLALAYWSVLLSLVKRAAIQTNLACRGKLSAISIAVLRDCCSRALQIRTIGIRMDGPYGPHILPRSKTA